MCVISLRQLDEQRAWLKSHLRRPFNCIFGGRKSINYSVDGHLVRACIKSSLSGLKVAVIVSVVRNQPGISSRYILR